MATDQRQRFNPGSIQRNLESAHSIIEAITYLSLNPQFDGWRLVRTLLQESVDAIDAEMDKALKREGD